MYTRPPGHQKLIVNERIRHFVNLAVFKMPFLITEIQGESTSFLSDW
jgi:hypothetical protein